MKNAWIFYSAAIIFGLTCASNLSAQTPSGIEAAEHDSANDRWFVSCGTSTLLTTSDLGESWDYFGSAQASHGMEVMGDVLFVIYGTQLRAYDLNTADLLDSTIVTGAGFLNGMGNDGVSTLIISDFSSGRILKVDASNPADMVVSTLVGDTGTIPNGVVVDVANGRAIIVNWGVNTDIIAVDIESGTLSTIVNGSGLGNCDGIDMDAEGRYYVSSWSPAIITRFSADFSESETVVGSGLSSPADISFDETNNILGVANSGNNQVTFHQFINDDVEDVIFNANENLSTEVNLQGRDLVFEINTAQSFNLTSYSLEGKLLGEVEMDLPSGKTRVAIDKLPRGFQGAAIIRVSGMHGLNETNFEKSFKQGLRRF